MPGRPYTFSAATRVEACPPSAVYPQVDETRPPATAGRGVHAFLEAVPKVGRAAALEAAPEDVRDRCSAIDLDAMPWLCSGAGEVAFAIDLSTGTARELGRGLQRAYGDLTDNEVAGTLDWASLVGDDAVGYLDFKSGFINAPPAAENFQLAVGAIAAARAWGRSLATVGIVKILDDGRIRYDVADLDQGMMAATFDRLRAADAKVRHAEREISAGHRPKLHLGRPQCDFCPARRACPARADQLAQLQALVPVSSVSGAIVTPEMVRDLLPKAKAAKQFIDSVLAELRAFGERCPVDLGDGWEWGPVPGDRILDGEAAFKVLSDVVGPSAAAVACPRKASQKSIEEAVRATNPPRGALGRIVDEAVEEIHLAGGSAREAAHVTEHRRKDR